jgi:hypothetical protein
MPRGVESFECRGARFGEGLGIVKRRFGLGVFVVVNGVLLAAVLYNLLLYRADKKALTGYIAELRSEGVIGTAADPYATAVSVRDFIHEDIECDYASCLFFRLSSRPFWGYRVSEIIEHREGQCVEATRLMINIFASLGIPSRKIYLFGENMHCVMEIFDGSNYVLLDTINSPAGLREYSTELRKGIRGYFIIMANGVVKPNAMMAGFGYTNYGYFNWNKIFNNRLLGCEVYMHEPVFNRFQLILENPPLFFACIFAVAMVCADIIGLSVVLSGRRKSVHD